MPSASSSPMSPALIAVVLSLLLGLQPVTTDLYLPALPVLTEAFGASMAQAQLTLSGLLLAFGVSQLVWGPLSDRFGRRPILLIGLAAYALASVASTLAPNIEWLIVARIVQGAAMGAAVMCARAIVRDLYPPAQGARVMTKAQTGLGVIACATVPLGSVLSHWMGFRFALLALTLFSAATLALIALRFQESLARKNPQALRPSVLLRNWRGIVRNRTFWSFTTLSIAAYGGLFTFLATSSFVFLKVLHLSQLSYGLLMSSICAAYVLGTLLCRRLLSRVGIRRTVAIAAVCTLVAGLALGVLALFNLQNVFVITPPLYLYMLAHGVHQACSQSGAIGPFPHAAGAASALNGFLTMLVAFAMGGWLGAHMDGTAQPMMLGICFWSVMIALTAWTLIQKYGGSIEH